MTRSTRKGGVMTSGYRRRSHNWSGWLGHPKRSRASVAFDCVRSALQNGYLSLLNAVGAYVVKGLPVGFRFIQTVHKVAPWCLPERVALALGFKLIRLQCFCVEVGQLHLQLGVRNSRIAYLVNKVRHGGFDIRIATTLRLREKFFDGPGGARPLVGRGKCLSRQIKDLRDAVDVKFQGAASQVGSAQLSHDDEITATLPLCQTARRNWR